MTLKIKEKRLYNYEKLRDYPGETLTKLANKFGLCFIKPKLIVPNFDVKTYNHHNRFVIYKKHYHVLDFATDRFVKRYLSEKLEEEIGYIL